MGMGPVEPWNSELGRQWAALAGSGCSWATTHSRVQSRLPETLGSLQAVAGPGLGVQSGGTRPQAAGEEGGKGKDRLSKVTKSTMSGSGRARRSSWKKMELRCPWHEGHFSACFLGHKNIGISIVEG